MKTSEIDDLLPQTIRAGILETLESLKELLNDNPNFLIALLRSCTKVGKGAGFYFNNIETLIANEYPDYLSSEQGLSLLKTSFKLSEHLCFQSKLINPDIFKSEGIWDNKDCRNKLDIEIFNFCNELEDNGSQHHTSDNILLIGDLQ